MDTTSPIGQATVDREKTAPFLVRAFVKIGGFHRLALFEDGALPTTDEHQIYTWRDATLRELLTTLRISTPSTPEYKHPLARFSFRALYADSTNRGHFAQKDLGIIYSRDILGEPGSAIAPFEAAPRLLEDADWEKRERTEREREERTLEELRFMPGDFLCVAVLLPKSVNLGGAAAAGEGTAKAAAGPGERDRADRNGWKSGGKGGDRDRDRDAGWGRDRDRDRDREPPSAGGAPGRGGGHWRGGSDGPAGRGGRGGGAGGRAVAAARRDAGDRDRDRDRNRDREAEINRGIRDRRPPPPPPRRGRDSPPLYRGGRRSRSRSRTRSPPPRRRNSRYD